MPAIPLPSGIEDKLDLLASSVRRLRVLRGVSWYLLIALVSPVLFIALDSLFTLSGFTRGLLTASWVVVVIAGLWWFVIRRMFGAIPPQLLAGAIEHRYPSLAERLSTLVELSDNVEASHGSAVMMQILGQETERRIDRLNLTEVVARRQSLRLAGIVAITIVVSLAPMFFVHGQNDRFRRFVIPFYAPATETRFRIVVSSGNPVVKRGDRVTLSGYLERVKPGFTLPDSMSLIYREHNSKDEKKLPMEGDDKSSYAATRSRVQQGFEYCLESEGIRSSWQTVSVVEAVDVSINSTVSIRPPVYASPQIPDVRRDAVAEIVALQYSIASFQWQLTQPASEARLEWLPVDAKPGQPPESLRVQLSADRRSATADITMIHDGSLRLILTGEKNLRTELPIAVRCRKDRPPAWEYILGLPDTSGDVAGAIREVRPTEPLRIELAVRDDIAVSSAIVEYGLANDTKMTVEQLSLKGLGTLRAEGSLQFSLAGKFREGDVVRFRLRARDHRSMPEYRLIPQEIAYPDSGWILLRLNSKALPLDEQDAIAQRDRMARRLAEIREQIELAAKELAVVRAEAVDQPRLAPEHAVRLRNAREELKRANGLMADTVRENAMLPALQQLTAALRAINDTLLKRADDGLRQMSDEPTHIRRDLLAKQSATDLQSALDRLLELEKLNAKIASNRLDQTRLHRLANEQSSLAERAAKATTPEEAKAIAEEQRALQQKLQDAINQSKQLKDSVEASEKEENDLLAKKLKKLDDSLDKLDRDANSSNQSSRSARLNDVAKQQKDLADQLECLTRRSETANRLTDTNVPAQSPAGKAHDLIPRKPEEALTEQNKSALELDRQAEAYDKLVRERKDAKIAAGQIARWQDDLRQRYADAVKQNPDKLPDELKKKLNDEQEAISKSIERLTIPQNDELQKLKRDTTRKAREATMQESSSEVQNRMKQTLDGLAKLAEKTPTNEARLRTAMPELEKLRREQEAITREVDEALSKNPEPNDELRKKLQSTAKKQEELDKKLNQLDLPGLEERRESMLDKQRKAIDDLTNAQTPDIPASQREAKRQLDRLNDDLNKRRTSEGEARELARMQEQLTDQLSKIEKFKPDELQRLQRQQKEVLERLNKLNDPSGSDATDAASQAEAELRKESPDVDELKKKSKTATDELQKLQRRLADAEEMEDRLERVARNRERQAERAGQNANQPTDAARAQDALRQVERDLEELANSRLGDNQGRRKELKDTLEKLKRTPQPDKARDLQEQSAKLARELADDYRNNTPPSQPTPAPRSTDVADSNDPSNGLPTQKDVDELRSMTKKQRELSQQLSKALDQASQPKSPEELGKLADEHKRTSQQTGELEREFEERAKQPGNERLGKAAEKLGKSKGQLDQAERHTRNGKTDDAEKARAQAIQQMKSAIESSGLKLDQTQAKPNTDVNSPAGKLLREAGELMQRAPPHAPTMQQAGGKIRNAAESLQRGNGPGPSEKSDTPAPEVSQPEMKEPDIVLKNLGKPWGELPGDIRNQITQELKAKYGEDYARIIKLYFEQLADRKSP